MTDPEIAKLQAKLDRLTTLAEQARALAAAAYERAERGPELLERIRAGEEWGRAYSEPEPLVSVRIATYNRAETLLERALPSVLRQTYPRWEAVIVGDGCTDDTAERLAALGDPRIRFHNLPVNGPYPEGPARRWLIAGVPAMNEAVRRAAGSWIAPLDDDDEWDDDHLEVLLGAALEARAEFAYGSCRGLMDGKPLRSIGAFPPRNGEVTVIASIYNAALREFEHDQASVFLDESHDWHLVRRMWAAGVRFEFVDRPVATCHLDHAREALTAGRTQRERR
jgi:glycosyltransferase involved in cell wall biosynthesis